MFDDEEQRKPIEFELDAYSNSAATFGSHMVGDHRVIDTRRALAVLSL
jgi:hypothetical protein